MLGIFALLLIILLFWLILIRLNLDQILLGVLTDIFEDLVLDCGLWLVVIIVWIILCVILLIRLLRSLGIVAVLLDWDGDDVVLVRRHLLVFWWDMFGLGIGGVDVGVVIVVVVGVSVVVLLVLREFDHLITEITRNHNIIIIIVNRFARDFRLSLSRWLLLLRFLFFIIFVILTISLLLLTLTTLLGLDIPLGLFTWLFNRRILKWRKLSLGLVRLILQLLLLFKMLLQILNILIMTFLLVIFDIDGRLGTVAFIDHRGVLLDTGIRTGHRHGVSHVR